MKKILLLLILFPLHTTAQFKVGSISVDQITFDAYIKDLYHKPDTIILPDPPQLWAGTYSEGEWNQYLSKSSQVNKAVQYAHENSIGTIQDSIWSDRIIKYPPVKPGTLRWSNSNDRPNVSSGYIPRTRYLIPRSPSEEDFVRWWNKYKK